MKLVLVTAGAANPSSSRLLGKKLTEASVAALADVGTIAQVTELELHTLGTELIEGLTRHGHSPAITAASEAIVAADGVIVVTPVYNGSYSGLFKLFVDVLDPRVMTGRPVLLAATGGTPRHSLMVEHSLLPLFYFFKADVAPLSVFAATADWADPSDLDYRVARASGAFAQRVLHARVPKALPKTEKVDYDDLLRS